MQLSLDDPATLKKLLQDCGVSAPITAQLDHLGYKTVALLGYALPHEGMFDELLEKLIPKDLGETVDLLSPGAASLRRVLRQCFDACQDQAGMPLWSLSPSLPLQNTGNSS